MSDHRPTNQADGKPESELTLPAESQPLLPGSSSADTQQLTSPAEGNHQSSTESAPALPERYPIPAGGHSTPLARKTSLETESLPPPPPIAEPYMEPVRDTSASILNESEAGKLKDMSHHGEKPKDGHAPDTDNFDTGTAKRISGNGEVQLEMDELSDPAKVDFLSVRFYLLSKISI